MTPARVGFYGKLPARGDFLRRGLPRPVAQAWDDWVERVLPAARCALGGDWSDCWRALRPWRFRLAPGLCGEALLSGIWLASCDRIGRPFPLLLAAQGVMLRDGFLDAAETLAREAIHGTVAPDDLITALRDPAQSWSLPDLTAITAPESGQTRWWRGGRACPDTDLETRGWPDAATFREMVRS